MSHDAHDRSEFEPQHPESADANGVIADPPGRSPAEVDDSALRSKPVHTSDPDRAEPK
jgi:hypothetical protein